MTRIRHPAKQVKSKAERTVIGRLAAADIPEGEIHTAIELMRTGDTDLLQRVIAGDLDLARAWRIARSLMKH
jgi:hypothetical protein